MGDARSAAGDTDPAADALGRAAVGLQRRVLAAMPKGPLPHGVREERVRAGSVPGRLFHREGAEDRWIFYLHGGGYSIGSVETHRDLILRLASAARPADDHVRDPDGTG